MTAYLGASIGIREWLGNFAGASNEELHRAYRGVAVAAVGVCSAPPPSKDEPHAMQRITITVDDDLMVDLDRLIAARGYQNR
jgi:hypothetical protein